MNTIAEALPTRSRSSALTGPTQETISTSKSELKQRYRRVRHFSRKLCETLEPEDYVIQTMPETSPTKWHLAHTSWFFETFIVKQFFRDYHSLHPQFDFLFNSLLQRGGSILFQTAPWLALPPNG